jgi:tetratricopeptide repeat protein 8
MLATYLWLCKVNLRMDQPKLAVTNCLKALEKFPGETAVMLSIARIYDTLADEQGTEFYKKVFFGE